MLFIVDLVLDSTRTGTSKYLHCIMVATIFETIVCYLMMLSLQQWHDSNSAVAELPLF
jgi:hypothetical protein